MLNHNHSHLSEFIFLDWAAPILVALVAIALASLVNEHVRHKFSVVMMAGAGAAYLSGGFEVYEFVFCTVITIISYRALELPASWLDGFRNLKGYQALAIGWTLHTCWDIAHHYYGNPIISFVPLSSFGCAICDLVLAVWYAYGAPSVWAKLGALRMR